MSSNRLLPWVLTISIAVSLGFLFSWAGVSAGLILAGALGSAVVALKANVELKLHSVLERFTAGVIGVLAGLPFAEVTPSTIVSNLIPGLAIAIASISICLFGGVLLARRSSSISLETGILALLPGAASAVVSIAKETHQDFRFIGFIQYLRLLIVSLTLPIVSELLYQGDLHVSAVSSSTPVSSLLLLLAIAFLAPYLGILLKLPAPSVLTPLAITAIIGLALPSLDPIQLPGFITSFVFICIGITCGGGLTKANLRLFKEQLPTALTFILITIVACGFLAIPLHYWISISPLESYLSTSPGGLSTVLAIASVGQAGTEVVTIQVTRVLLLFIIAGYLTPIVRFLYRRGKEK